MGRSVTCSAQSRNNPPRIGIDARIPRPEMSGVEYSIYHLLEHLPTVAPEFRFVIYHSSGVSPAHDAGESAVCRKRALLPTSLRAVRIFWQQALLPRRARLDGLDLLHAPAYTAPIRANLPVVLTIYDTIALKFPHLCKRLNALHYRMFMPPSARRAARIIVPSETTRDDVVRTMGIAPEKIRVVPLGVPAEFQPVDDPKKLAAVRAELNLPERYILFSGNLEPKKNLTALIQAFAEARRSGRVTHRLVIAGRKAWRYSNIFRMARELRLAGMIRFLGRVPRPLLPALYSGADVFAFPSLYEGFGLPPLEAMACGTPVVTTTAGAIPEVVGNAALTVSPGSVRELRIAIEKVLANQFLRRHLRELGLNRAAQFSWQQTARRTADVYAEVLQ